MPNKDSVIGRIGASILSMLLGQLVAIFLFMLEVLLRNIAHLGIALAHLPEVLGPIFPACVGMGFIAGIVWLMFAVPYMATRPRDINHKITRWLYAAILLPAVFSAFLFWFMVRAIHDRLGIGPATLMFLYSAVTFEVGLWRYLHIKRNDTAPTQNDYKVSV